MTKQKQKLTPQRKLEKERLKNEFMYVFMNGKQVRVKRPPMIDGIPADEFIRNNADPIWLHQHEMWELIENTGPGLDDFCPQVDNSDNLNFQNPVIKPDLKNNE